MAETGIQKAGRVALPPINSILSDERMELQSEQNVLNAYLNIEPNEKWILKNKYAGNTSYIPIARLEWLMTAIFKRWWTEVISVQSIANSVVVHVRVHYQNPFTGEIQWTDGVGASNLQTDKGASATDSGALKSSAVEMGAPKAKTEAVRDAIGDLGKIFGRDLNRKDSPAYDFAVTVTIDETEAQLIESAAKPHGPEYLTALLSMFNVTAVREIPKSDFKKVLARIADRANHG